MVSGDGTIRCRPRQWLPRRSGREPRDRIASVSGMNSVPSVVVKAAQAKEGTMARRIWMPVAGLLLLCQPAGAATLVEFLAMPALQQEGYVLGMWDEMLLSKNQSRHFQTKAEILSCFKEAIANHQLGDAFRSYAIAHTDKVTSLASGVFYDFLLANCVRAGRPTSSRRKASPAQAAVSPTARIEPHKRRWDRRSATCPDRPG